MDPAGRGPTLSRRSVVLAAAGMTVLAGFARSPTASPATAVAGPAVDATGRSEAGLVRWPGRSAPSARLLSAGPSIGSRATTALATAHDANSGRPLHRGVESYVSAASRELVLSIDDGPSEPYTHEILTILRRYDVRATFCMVGSNVAAHRDVAKAVAAGGHQLANHTWSHAWLPHLSHRAMVREIERAQAELDRVTDGTVPTVFRAPFGAWSSAILDLCWQHQMRAVGWSIDPRDWAKPPAHQIVSDVLAHAAPGRIILDHDGGGNRSHTVEALRVYLPRLLHQGYRFVLP
jgi:peptidoglycan/xylan/chitin deacetylase (PgdA/CDA1 family)